MSKLRELTEAVKKAKKEYGDLRYEANYCHDRGRREELEHELSLKTNEVYDAVRYLCDYLYEETGVTMLEFNDLLRSYGYVTGPGIPEPKSHNRG